MRLFLTSSPCTVHAPDGVPLPFVYNESNRFMELLSAGLRAPFSAVMIAAWPDASASNDEMAWAFGEALRYHGLPLTDMCLIDCRNKEELAARVSQSGLVFLSGGHVPTENAFFAEIGLREALRDYRGTVIGISAGSMNAAETVYAQPEENGESLDPNYRRFIPGLGLTSLQILPHYNQVHDRMLDGRRLFDDITVPDSMGGKRFWVLTDGAYILQEGRHATLYGEAWCIHDGAMFPVTRDGEQLDLSGYLT